MVDRDEIEAEIRDNGLEVIETGNWHIAEGTYDGLTRAVQSDRGEERAIAKLINKFYERKREQERRERERKRREQEAERKREMARKREEMERERMEQEQKMIEKRFEENC